MRDCTINTARTSIFSLIRWEEEIERMCITLTFHFGCVFVCMCVLKSSLCSSFYFVDAFYCLPAFLLLPFLCNSSRAKKSTLSFELIIFKAPSFIRWTAKKGSDVDWNSFLSRLRFTSHWWMDWTSCFFSQDSLAIAAVTSSMARKRRNLDDMWPSFTLPTSPYLAV